MKLTLVEKGTLSHVAIQSICPDTGKRGDFLYIGENHHVKGSRVTPIYPSLSELFSAIRENWRENTAKDMYEKI